MTVGTGFYGRSSVGENVGPQHLVQWVRMAYNKNKAYDLSQFNDIQLPECEVKGAIDYSFTPKDGIDTGHTGTVSIAASSQDLRAMIHEIIIEEIKSLHLVTEEKRE